jgi:hypothetical protein
MAREDNTAAQGVADRRKTMEKQNAEYYERQEAMRPTPTQEENDLAKVGALDIDSKEPDGSEPEEEAVRRTMSARLPGNNPYQNRAMSGDEVSPPKARNAAAKKARAPGARKGGRPTRAPQSAATLASTPAAMPAASPAVADVGRAGEKDDK